MSDYQMNINGKVEAHDLKNIGQYLGMVNFNDSLIITLQGYEENDSGAIHELCKKNRITIGKEENRTDGTYIIRGTKEKYFNE